MTTLALERPIDLTVNIETAGTVVEGDWTIPLHPHGVILLINGPGSSRLGRRNREVAHWMYDKGFATLLVDLLTVDEEHEDALTGALRLDVELLTGRVKAATHWVKEVSELRDLPRGYLASGIGSAAALVAAAREPDLVKAIVSRGGRPDLAGVSLHTVTTSTLLIVGGSDPSVCQLNRWALRRLNGEKELAIIPGANHLFEEAGTLEAMCKLASRWFDDHMPPLSRSAQRHHLFGRPWTPVLSTTERAGD